MTEQLTQEASAKRRKKMLAALIGVALALACSALPSDYQKPCQAVVAICTGGRP